MSHYLTYTIYADAGAMAGDIDFATAPGEIAAVSTRLKMDRQAIAILVNTKGWRVLTFTPDDVQLRKPVPGDWSPS